MTTTSAGLFASGGGIAVVDVAGGELTPLVDGGRSYYATPFWSPDGAIVAAVRIDDMFEGRAVLIGLADGDEVEVASRIVAIAGWQP